MKLKRIIHIFQSLLYSIIYIALIYIIINVFLGKYLNEFWSYISLISTSSNSSFNSNLEIGEDGLKSRPEYGKQYGEVIIESKNINLPLYFGDSLNELKNGIGQNTRSFCPGEGRTIILTGHNTDTKLNKITEMKKGEKIVINTTYGTYEYKVSNTSIESAKTDLIYKIQKDKERLIIYTKYIQKDKSTKGYSNENVESDKIFIVFADLINSKEN